MAYTGLSEKIAAYIAGRAHERLEKFNKKAAKKCKATQDEAALAELNRELAEEKLQIQQQYHPANWLTNAASRAGQIQFVTHALKFTHSEAKGSNLYAPDGQQHSPFLDENAVLSTASLNHADIDVVGNAAALDVGKLLQLKEDGTTLIECVHQADSSPLEPFSQLPGQLNQWMSGFHQVLVGQEVLSSHKLTKQLYFPLSDGSYHLLAPLHASSLTQAIYEKVASSRFTDEAKAARTARQKKQQNDAIIIDYPHTALQRFGGTKPQNISQLNSGRGGKSYLFSCAPPFWRTQSRPPLNIKNIIESSYSYRVRKETQELKHYLLAQAGKETTVEIRRVRAKQVDHLIDELIQLTAEIQSLPSGWSQFEECHLPRHQQLWLDPGRIETDQDFAFERDKKRWPKQVADDFALWLNRRLEHKKLAMGAVEHQEWRSLVKTKLSLLKNDLEAFSQ